MRAAALALSALLAAGCHPGEPETPAAPCRVACDDGHGTCDCTEPLCMGPDQEGYYCEPTDIVDPTGTSTLERRGRSTRARSRSPL